MSDIHDNIRALFDATQTCMLATLDDTGHPEASTTPYFLYKNTLYVFISELAAHTQNLKKHEIVSLMLTNDEAQTKNIFARKRLIFKGSASFIQRDSKEFDEVMPLFEKNRGKTLALLKSLKDFHLVAITARSGTYVEGFGAAYSFQGMAFEEAIQEQGK